MVYIGLYNSLVNRTPKQYRYYSTQSHTGLEIPSKPLCPRTRPNTLDPEFPLNPYVPKLASQLIQRYIPEKHRYVEQ